MCRSIEDKVNLQVLNQGIQPFKPIVGLFSSSELSRNVALPGPHMDPDSCPDLSRDRRNSLFDGNWSFFLVTSRQSL